MLIPLIGGILGLLGCFIIGGSFYCATPICCEDDEFLYISSAERSDIAFYSD
jgi:hypothetical protein